MTDFVFFVFFSTGLYFHVVGEGCVRLRNRGQERFFDKESYIDFRMRLLGEAGEFFEISNSKSIELYIEL